MSTLLPGGPEDSDTDQDAGPPVPFGEPGQAALMAEIAAWAAAEHARIDRLAAWFRRQCQPPCARCYQDADAAPRD